MSEHKITVLEADLEALQNIPSFQQRHLKIEPLSDGKQFVVSWQESDDEPKKDGLEEVNDVTPDETDDLLSKAVAIANQDVSDVIINHDDLEEKQIVLDDKQLDAMINATLTVIAKDEIDAIMSGNSIDDERAFKTYRYAIQELQQNFVKNNFHLVDHDISKLDAKQKKQRQLFEETLTAIKENTTESLANADGNMRAFIEDSMWVELPKKKVYDLYNLDMTHGLARFKKSMQQFISHSVYVIKDRIIPLISEMDLQTGKDTIRVQLHMKLAPFVLSPTVLDQPWGKINLMVQNNLHSVPAMRLYSKCDSQLRYYYYLAAGKGKTPQNKHQRELLLHPTWTYQGFREFTGIEGKKRGGKQIYSLAKSFNSVIVKKSVEDINQNTNINISYEIQRERHGAGKIKAYVFTISYKPEYLQRYFASFEKNETVDYKAGDLVAEMSKDQIRR